MKKLVLLSVLAALAASLSLWGQAITVSSPTAGKEWCIGGTYSINWQQAGAPEPTIDIRLRVAGAPDSTPPALAIIDDTANDGAHSWTIPASVTPGSYFIRVKTDTTVGDSAVFVICADPQHLNVSPTDKFGVAKKVTIEETTLDPSIQNCHFILQNSISSCSSVFNNWHLDYFLWEGMPQGLANIGFVWFRSMLTDKDGDSMECVERQYEVWKSRVSFSIGLQPFIGKGEVKEARLIITRKWKTPYQYSWAIGPGLSDPCLAGVVLLDDNPPCEWGERTTPRVAVPSPQGTAIPLPSPNGNSWVVDVTERLQQVVTGKRNDYGFMLYAGYEQDATGGGAEDGHIIIYNAGCYEVKLYIKFARR